MVIRITMSIQFAGGCLCQYNDHRRGGMSDPCIEQMHYPAHRSHNEQFPVCCLSACTPREKRTTRMEYIH